MGPISPDDLRFNRFGLSQQESRVLALAMTGRIDKQIAAEMGISLGTVRVYWKRIRQKVGGTRSEVIAELARNSLKLDFDGERSKVEQLEKDLEDSVARERELRIYEAAFESLPTPLAILDGDANRIVRVNSAFATLHGYSTTELESLPVAALAASEEAATLMGQVEKARLDGKHVQTGSTRRRKDGSTFPARLVLSGNEETWVLALEA